MAIPRINKTSNSMQVVQTVTDDNLYELHLAELRNLYGLVSKSYDNLRTKSITLLGGEVAILGFIFGSKINLPQLVYGVVLYGVGLFFFSVSFLIFLWVISPDQWMHPVDLHTPDDLKKLQESKESYTKHLVNEYILCIQTNSVKLDKRSRPFVFAVYTLSIGILIMLMLKYGGGNV